MAWHTDSRQQVNFWIGDYGGSTLRHGDWLYLDKVVCPLQSHRLELDCLALFLELDNLPSGKVFLDPDMVASPEHLPVPGGYGRLEGIVNILPRLSLVLWVISVVNRANDAIPGKSLPTVRQRLDEMGLAISGALLDYLLHLTASTVSSNKHLS
ncbi:hypothetical protein ES703_118918 [subsurface metagenome]